MHRSGRLAALIWKAFFGDHSVMVAVRHLGNRRMSMTVHELIASVKTSLTSRIDAVLAGNFDGNFIITDGHNLTLDPTAIIDVSVPNFLRTLRVAGVSPRGGGVFAFGGQATIDGTFEIAPDSVYPLKMTAFTFIEIRPRRGPTIRIFPPLQIDCD